MRSKSPLFPARLLLAGLIGFAAASHAETNPRYKQLLDDGKAADAYKQMADEEFTQAGDPDFDYLFGVAALESGEPGRATLAFERVIARLPAHLGARLDMGRAYFAQGDHDRARFEFETIRKLNPPLAVQSIVERYLVRIDQAASRTGTRSRAYAEFSLGRDSNPSHAPASSTVPVGPFLTATLDNASERHARNYGGLALGGEISRAINQDWRLFGAADARARGYLEQNDFSNAIIDYRGGLQYNQGIHQVRLSLGGNLYQQDSAGMREIWSATGDYRRAIGNDAEIAAFAQLSTIRHHRDVLKPQDANQLLAGLGWLKTFGTTHQHAIFGGVFVVNEQAEGGRVDGDRQAYGARAGISLGATPTLDVFAMLVAQQGKYENETNVLRPETYRRQDTQYDLSLGANWRFAPQWTLRPALTYTRMDSNVPIYDINRTDISITVRRDFR